jgi:hypothetical protein
MEHRRSSIACTTAAVPPTGGQLVTSERGVCGGPLAFHYANLMSHTAFRQSLACVSLLYQVCAKQVWAVWLKTCAAQSGPIQYACSLNHSELRWCELKSSLHLHLTHTIFAIITALYHPIHTIWGLQLTVL